MALGGGKGCQINLDPLMNALPSHRLDAALFAEMIGASIIEVKPESIPDIENALPVIPLGVVVPDNQIKLKWSTEQLIMEMPDLIRIWERPFQEVAK